MALRYVDVEESFIGADVHVRLSAVLGDEDLAVNVGVHRSRVVVEIRVYLDRGDSEFSCLEDLADGCSYDALAYAGHYSAGDEYELRQRVTVRGFRASSKD